MRYSRAHAFTKLRSRLDQAMDEMIRLQRRNEVGADLIDQLQALYDRVHALQLAARGEIHGSFGYCAWCGELILREPADDGHGVKYHVVCLEKRREIHRRPASEPDDGVVNPDAPGVIKALEDGMACLSCLITMTALPEAKIIGALRRLRTEVTMTVGSCSRCGGRDRLICELSPH